MTVGYLFFFNNITYYRMSGKKRTVEQIDSSNKKRKLNFSSNEFLKTKLKVGDKSAYV